MVGCRGWEGGGGCGCGRVIKDRSGSHLANPGGAKLRAGSGALGGQHICKSAARRVFERGVGGRSKGQVSMWRLLQRLDVTAQPTHHGITGTEWNMMSTPARKSF